MIAELVSNKRGKFDHIVIETTGLANPAPIIQTFYAEDQVFNDVKLDGVVILVDAKHADFHLNKVKPKGVVNEAVEQIAYADRIIVNKMDLVGESDVTSLIQRIRNRDCCRHGKFEGGGCWPVGHGHDHDHHYEHDHHHHHDEKHDHDHHHDDHYAHDHTHDPGVTSVSIVCEGKLDIEKLCGWELY